MTLRLTALISIALFTFAALPGTAGAVSGWDWWDAVYAQQNHHASCPGNPPSKSDWETTLGSTADDPHFTELTVFFIAYPCGGTPSWFVEFREWLNYEVHSQGTWDSEWTTYDFYDLKDLVLDLDQTGAGFWGDGPWD